MSDKLLDRRMGAGLSLTLIAIALFSLGVLLSSAIGAPAAEGLWITRVTPLGGASSPFNRLEIQFSGAVLSGTFTLGDVLLTGPGGVITPTALNQLAADRYELVSSGTGLSTYSLVIGPDVRDLSNLLMDQNHNGTPGEPGDAYTGALFSAGVTITDTQTTYEGQNLIIYGNTATINGPHTFASVAVLGTATLTHSPATASAEYRLDLTITDTLWITATGKIDVTSRGYLAGYTYGNTTVGGATGWSGGSYGGLGYSHSGSTNRVYGDYRNPNELGSGGSAAGGVAGGGLVRITAHAAVIEGAIQANGAAGVYPQNSGGSGGGIWLSVGTLSGRGTIAANGGVGSHIGYGGGDGGGGRVAVYYDTLAGFDPARQVTAHGSYIDGSGVGTVYLKQNGGEGQLRIDSHGATTGMWTPLGMSNESVFVVDHLIISGTNVIAAPEHDMPIQANNVSIFGNGNLTHQPATITDTYALRMDVTGTLLISATGKIDVTGRGYLAGYTYGNTTVGGATGWSGGSYGGLGYSHSGSTNRVYGDYRNPNELGSGGSAAGGVAGGGLVRITAHAAVIEGAIQANGAAGVYPQNSGGSGGGIWLSVGTLSGRGTIAANGGVGSHIGYGGGDGGGGRVAVYYDTLAGFDPARQVTAHGSYIDGSGVGTVYLKQNGGEGQLRIDSHGATTGMWTPLGMSNESVFVVDHLIISGTNVIAAPEHDMPIQANNVSIFGNGNLTHQPATITDTYALRMDIADTLLISTTGKIDVSGRGYVGGRTLGNTTAGAASGSAGGSYGGLGVAGGYAESVTNWVYGDYRNPNELGSGGGMQFGAGGAGGGLVRIVAGAARIDGQILADGAYSRMNPAGSGGGIWLQVGVLSGSGSIAATGGTGSSVGNFGGSGGGGRVAVYYDTLDGFDPARITAHGGNMDYGSAPSAVGTVYLKQTGGEGQLRIDSHGATTGMWTPLGQSSDTAFVVDHLVVSGADVIAAPEHDMPIQANNVSILGNGNLTHQPATADKEYALRLTVADTLLISTTGKIDVSARGYLAGRTLGNTIIGGASGWAGGSYGGLGNGATNFTYGDYRHPNEPGSGGGLEQGRPGGGLVRITARAAVIEGAILANGATGVYPLNGGGSGGGILLNVGTLSGNGIVAANGGNGSSIGYGGGSGGGGRIAVYYWDSIALPSANVTANGGTGGAGPGQPGSVYISHNPYFSWSRPVESLFHDTERLEWAALGINPVSVTVNIAAFNAGQPYPLGAGLAPLGDSLFWDTTSVPDGCYELRATFYNLSGQVIGQATRTVLVNNSVSWHGGRLTATETWTADRVHVVESPVSLATGVTLTIQAGAVVKFAPEASIGIEDGAALLAPATANAPIIFTTLTDDSSGGDTNLDGAQTRPTPGYWNGVVALGAGQFNSNDHVELRYYIATHSGVLAGNETWSGTLLHQVVEDVTVPGAATLTIEPGAIIKFNPKRGILVEAGGQLFANGTVAQPIVFTSLLDDSAGGDSNHDGDNTTPAPGDWMGIQSSGVASLDHVIMQYGANSKTGAYQFGAASYVYARSGSVVTVSNSLLLDGLYEGIVDVSNVVVKNTVIARMDRAINLNAVATLVNVTIDSNNFGLWCHGGTANVTNSIISNNTQSGDCGAFRYNNIWPGSYNGQNGNVSVDPQFKDAAGGNYRLRYVSPMIDAADGTAAPPTDIMGAPRYDDPRTPNTGITTTLGAFADMGAYEFVETAQSNLDLVVDSVIGPLQVTATQQVQVMWTVRNIGTQTVAGTWRDAVALMGPDGTVLEAGEFVSAATLGPNQTATFSATVRVPGGTEGDYRWQVRANSRGDVFEGQNWDNNVGIAQAVAQLYVPVLTLGMPVDDVFAGFNIPTWYRVVQPAETDLLITLDAEADSGRCRIYAGLDRMPTADDFDLRSLVWDTPDARLGIPAVRDARSIYLLIAPESLPVGSLGYRIQAQATGFSLDDLGLTSGGNAGQVTIPLFGSGFAEGMSARLHPTTGGSDLVAVRVLWINSTSALATFDLEGAATGVYDVSITQVGATDTLPGAFTVVTGSGGVLEARLVLPQALRRGMPFRGMIEFANAGDADLPAPLLILESKQGTPVWPANSPQSNDSSLQIIGVAPEGFSGGVLRPGERHTYPFNAIAPSWGGTAGYRLYSKAGDATEAVDWDAFEAAVRPDPAHPLWDAAWDALAAHSGVTYGDYAAALAAAAEETQRYNVPTIVVRELLQYMLRREMVAIRQTMLGGMLYLEDTDHPLGPVSMLLQETSTQAAFFTESWYDGSFGFRDVTPGVYALILEGYLPTPAATITVTAGMPPTDLVVVVRQGAVVQGRVVRGQSDVGVDGAVVSAYAPGDKTRPAAVAETDINGAYALRGLEAGVYWVTANAEEYIPSVPQFVVLQERQVRSLMLSLTTGGSIVGQVKLPNNAAAAGALVYVENTRYRSPVVTANAQGMFRIAGLPGGVYDVVADRSGYGAGMTHNVGVSGTATTSGVVVMLSVGGSVAGTVTDAATGLPLGDVVISAHAPGVYTLPVVSLVNGAYTFPDLPAGTHEFEFSAEGYLKQRVEVEVIAGANTTRDIALRPAGVIAGQAQRNGQPLAGLAVYLSPVDRGLPLRVVSSENGQFAFTGLEDGTYHVVAGTEAGLIVARQTYTLSQANNTYAPILNLGDTLLSGVVRTAGGVPVAQASVTLFEDGAPIARTRTDDSGLYRFLVLQDGLFDLWVESWDTGLVSRAAISITAGTDVQVDLNGGAETVEVHVIALNTGAPVSNTSVVLLPPNGAPEHGVFLAARTGEEGIAQFPALPAGVYRLQVRAPGLLPYQAPLTVPVTSAITVTLAAGPLVQGYLVDADNMPLRGAASFFHQASGQTLYAFSNAEGLYTADILPEGRFDVWLSDGEHRPVFVPDLWVEGNITHTLGAVLEAEGATISGTVVSAAGDPLDAMLVGIVDRAGIPVLVTLTNPDGSFELGPLPPLTATLKVWGMGWRAVQTDTLIPDSGILTLTLTMSRPVAIGLQPAPATAQLAAQLQRVAAVSEQLDRAVRGLYSVTAVQGFCTRQMGIQMPTRVNFPYEGGEYNYMYTPPPEKWCSAYIQAFDQADDSHKLMKMAFDSWWSAYQALEQLSCADLKLALAKAGLVGAKAVKTLWTLNSAWGRRASPLDDNTINLQIKIFDAGIKHIEEMSKYKYEGNYNLAEYEADRAAWLAAQQLDEGSKNTPVAGTLYSLYTTGLNFYKLNKSVEDMVKGDVGDSLERYLVSQALYHAAALQHQRNTLKVKSAAESHSDDSPENQPKEPPKPPQPKPEDAPDRPLKVTGDPNDKVGVGVGIAGWVNADQVLHYTIHFENVPTATAPVQLVVVTDILDMNLDWSTLALQEIGFNGVTIAIPSGRQQFNAQAFVASDPNPIQVRAALDFDVGIVRWELQSVDRVTGGIPEDPLAGFLPPNDATQRGEGYVMFTIRPRANLGDGAVITNQARIVFDVNPPIDTNVVTNTLDLLPPVSRVEPLSPTVTSPFTVTWSGSDSGAGIRAYDIYAATDNGPFVLWQAAVTMTQASFAGEVGHSYAFYSVATDNVGHREVAPEQADAATTVAEAITGLSAVNDSPTTLGSSTTLTATVAAGTDVTYTWAFGDGAAGSGAVVNHTYPAVGIYTAIVTASNTINTLTATTTVTITSTDIPISGLSAQNNSPTALGQSTTLTATITAGTNVAYTWAFGDGAAGSGAVISHTYPAVGVYTATVTATNSLGQQSATTVVTITPARIRIFLPLVLRNH